MIDFDVINFETSYGFIKRFISPFDLNTYKEKLLTKRYGVIRQYATTDKWRAMLHTHF